MLDSGTFAWMVHGAATVGRARPCGADGRGLLARPMRPSAPGHLSPPALPSFHLPTFASQTTPPLPPSTPQPPLHAHCTQKSAAPPRRPPPARPSRNHPDSSHGVCPSCRVAYPAPQNIAIARRPRVSTTANTQSQADSLTEEQVSEFKEAFSLFVSRPSARAAICGSLAPDCVWGPNRVLTGHVFRTKTVMVSASPARRPVLDHARRHCRRFSSSQAWRGWASACRPPSSSLAATHVPHDDCTTDDAASQVRSPPRNWAPLCARSARTPASPSSRT
jgi:hypothetical protein